MGGVYVFTGRGPGRKNWPGKSWIMIFGFLIRDLPKLIEIVLCHESSTREGG
jgi:hypothetical protein